MTCEVGGQVLDTQQVFVARGQSARPSLPNCERRVAEARRAPAPAAQPPVVAPAPQVTPPARCTASSGFRSIRTRASGRRVALGFTRAVTRPVTVDVFQQSVGRRVIGERLVARFTNRSRGLTWNGRANRRGRRVTDGYYFVRYRIAQPGGETDVRRVTLRRVDGRFTSRPDFYRRATCDLLSSFKLERPVFGGRSNRDLGISYRLADAARVEVVVRRGSRVVRRFAASQRSGDRTFRLRLDAEGLARGDYRVTLSARRGATTVRSVLTTRRL
jgi:hypothetical protein